MLLTPGRAEERIWHLVRDSGPLRARADDVARRLHCETDEVHRALDELVARGVLRRHEIPGDSPVYWS